MRRIGGKKAWRKKHIPNMHTIKDQIQVAEQILKRIDVPLIPTEIIELQKLFAKSEMPDPKKIHNLVASNPMLASELISLANLLSLNRNSNVKIKDINSAIYRLGNNQIKNYILSIYIKELLDKNRISGLSYHSRNIAVIASMIAKYSKFINQGEAYLLGLLHDIGTFALTEIEQDYGQTFVGKLVEHYDSHKREYERFGTTHSAMGYVITKSLSLPNSFSQTILLHHEHDLSRINNEKLRHMVAVIELAHALLLEQKHKEGKCPENKKLLQNAQQALQLNDEGIASIKAGLSDFLL